MNPTETMGDIISRLERDLKSALEEIERQSFSRHGLEQENAALKLKVTAMENGDLTYCAFCGEAYPCDQGAEQIVAHVLTCPDHPLSEFRSRAERAEAENAALRAMLKRLQWAAENYEEPACPICWCEEPIHEDDCALAALLTGEDDANA